MNDECHTWVIENLSFEKRYVESIYCQWKRSDFYLIITAFCLDGISLFDELLSGSPEYGMRNNRKLRPELYIDCFIIYPCDGTEKLYSSHLVSTDITQVFYCHSKLFFVIIDIIWYNVRELKESSWRKKVFSARANWKSVISSLFLYVYLLFESVFEFLGFCELRIYFYLAFIFGFCQTVLSILSLFLLQCGEKKDSSFDESNKKFNWKNLRFRNSSLHVF